MDEALASGWIGFGCSIGLDCTDVTGSGLLFICSSALTSCDFEPQPLKVELESLVWCSLFLLGRLIGFGATIFVGCFLPPFYWVSKLSIDVENYNRGISY